MAEQLNEDMLVNINNTLQSENESLKRENTALKNMERLFKGRLELLGYFVEHTKTNYQTLFNDFISNQPAEKKIFYTKIFEELKKMNLFSN